MYKGYFINLDRSTERKSRFVDMLGRVGATARYERFAATDGFAAAPAHKTTLDPGALGAYLSHLSAWKANRGSSAHLHIIEDDSILPQGIVPMLDAVLAQADAELGEWDVLFTEVFIPVDLGTFASFEAKLREAATSARPMFLALGGGQFAGMTSYVVRAKSIGKVIQVLEPGWSRGIPIDIYVRSAIAAGELNAFVSVPFLTTVSSQEDASDVRGVNDRSRIVTSFLRRAFFIQADIDALLREMHAMTKDARTQGVRAIYAEVIRFVCSDQFSNF